MARTRMARATLALLPPLCLPSGLLLRATARRLCTAARRCRAVAQFRDPARTVNANTASPRAASRKRTSSGRALHQHGASFETPASRAPQDEEKSFRALTDD